MKTVGRLQLGRLQLGRLGGAAISVALGAMLLRLSIGLDFERYVRAGMRPYLIVAGAVLIVFGVASGLAGGHETGTGHEAEPDDHEGHGHGIGLAPRAGLLLLAPLVVVFLVSPPALGAYAAKRTAILRAQLQPATSLPPVRDGAIDLTVGDFSERTSFGQDLTQGRYRLVGFVVDDPSGLPGRFLLTRLKIVCCAADAQTAQITVVDAPAVPRAGTWLTVVGDEVVDDQGYPQLQALQVQPVKTPPDPYE